ncbi:DNA polymerase III subunit alpha [Aureliella helgolandensis]|uniref:DNA polymerase III subunit alpha n=1 Tax=Aureliella helgolandensis TaxID=2527968 RepID=A0A518GEM9_9BACT|nr:DNA polymerase III subunit alpha [Aureliella helgolandensis]QDV27052.1 DNA polymerase III subunit alpha [Aureliella helgolandensis]
MSGNFVHLHCHSHYSLLDGASSVSKLIDRAKSHGMNALALTDHGNLHGALEFYKKSKAAGINPIIGYEAYIAPGSRHSRGDASSSKSAAYHLTLLAQNRTGFKNLVKLASLASLEGFYFKPRIDRECLEAHSEGIVCLSGCVSSEFSRAILNNKDADAAEKQAIEIAQWFHGVFDDRYYIEIMNNHLEIQRLQLEGAVNIANKIGLPLVATSDAHYADKEDAEIQDVLLCINTGKFRTDSARMKMEGNQFYLRSPEEMYASFPGLESAVARSQEIANTVDIDLELGNRYFPKYDVPPQQTADEYLRELCTLGLKDRYAGNEEMLPGGELSQVVQDRLDRELGVIQKLGFANYFLIVWDFVRYSREQKVPATARGSGVGALVCYALYMSHVCPIKYDLLFERFLDESRLEAPDIDIDFCKDRRLDIVQYVRDKYGEDNVAQIGTFGTLAARAAIKDVGRALGIPLMRVNQITEMVPDELKITISKALEKNIELKAVYDSDQEIQELLDIAMKLEGNARNVGTHAAAVVIADEPLTEYVPLSRVSGKTDIITQWSMNDVEDAGLLKMDFLGLRNLTILAKAVEIIQETTGEEIDILKFPLDDKPTFALLQRGETKGVFQLESGGIRDLLQRMKPDKFSDIIATNALYRPGPLEGGMVDDFVAVKHGRKEAIYLHQVLKDILEETNGVMVYQEQVMRILNRLGGIQLASAYTCIKAISKKKEALIAQNEAKFLEGATEKGLTAKQAQELWDMILKFAGYGFNKSHSTAYALVAYQTAYLKAHYPVEFMAALLSGDIQGRNFKRKDSLVEHLEDCDRMGIKVVPPDVNTSFVDFAVRDGQIRFGLSAIKGCGGASGETIVAIRERDGEFTSIFDFCERVDPSACNRATIETLIKAGAFDSLGVFRSQLMAVVEKAIQAGASALADKKSGQMNFFEEMQEPDQAGPGISESLPDIPELPDKTKLFMEKEVLGMFLSAHPMEEYKQMLSTFCSHTTLQLKDVKDRSEVIVGGMISSIKLANTRNPKPGAPSKYANFDLEDLEGAARCICWPDGYENLGHLIVPESVVIMRATVDKRGGADDVNLLANEIIPIEEANERFTAGIRIHIDQNHHEEEEIPKLNEILRGYPGSMEVLIALKLLSGDMVQLKSKRHRVSITPELRGRLNDLLGTESHRLMVAPPKPRQNQGGGRRGRDN